MSLLCVHVVCVNSINITTVGILYCTSCEFEGWLSSNSASNDFSSSDEGSGPLLIR